MSNFADRTTAPRLSEPFAVVADHNQLLAAIRRRVEELELSYEVVEHLAGLQSGYLAKIIGNPPIKRASPFTSFLILQALGLRVKLEKDPELIEKLSKRWTKRKLPKSKKSIPDAGTYKYEVTPDLMRRRGRLGGYARAAKLSRERLSEIGRAAVNDRWSKKQCRDRQAQGPASP